VIHLIHGLTLFGAESCKSGFFGLPSWYQYLKLGNDCQVVDFTVPGDLILVALAIIDILIRLAGLVAVFFVIIGGIQYATSQGNPDDATKARNTIVNALIGLALTIVAVSFVSFLGSKLGG
jgi:hypothetical protein